MMVMTMMVAMAVVMAMRAVVVAVLIVVIVMVDALAWPRAARILAEYQRLDGHRHSVGRHADAA